MFEIAVHPQETEGEYYCQVCGDGPHTYYRGMPWLCFSSEARDADYSREHLVLGCFECAAEFSAWKQHRFVAIHTAVPKGGYMDLIDWERDDEPYLRSFLTPLEELSLWAETRNG